MAVDSENKERLEYIQRRYLKGLAKVLGLKSRGQGIMIVH